jgi:hypothetical protein
MLQKLIGATLIIAVMTGAATAQLMPSFSLHKDEKKLTPEEQAQQDATDHAYKSTLQKIPEKKVVDPWGNVRDTAPTASAKAAPKNKQQ